MQILKGPLPLLGRSAPRDIVLGFRSKAFGRYLETPTPWISKQSVSILQTGSTVNSGISESPGTPTRRFYEVPRPAKDASGSY